MPSPRAESRFAGWIAPLWILALASLLFLPTEYRGGASAPHRHALLQLLLDAQDGRFQHTHSHSEASAGFSYDWLDPTIADNANSTGHARPDVGQQPESVPALSIITFLVVLPPLAVAPNALPRITVETRRLDGRTPRVLYPPPKGATSRA